MKIGIDARLWNETGVGRYIRNLVWQLQQIDKKNEYVLFAGPQVIDSDQATKFGLKVIETDIRWHTFQEQLKFPAILEKEKLDLVHFPYFSVPVFYRRPFVITIHDLIINHYPTGKATTLPLPLYYAKHFGYQFVMKQAAQKAKKIITVSNATKSEIVEHIGVAEEKVVVTYEGVDKNLVSKLSTRGESAFSGIGNEKKEKFFLYVGNAYPHKNLDRLVKAFSEINENKDVKLYLVGNEDYFYNRLKEKIHELQLDETIVLLGNVSDEKLAELYAHASALITPSLMEGFGLPGLEAMQHGTLVLASAIPVYKEIYQDAAVYFDPLDVSAMRATILAVLDQEKKFEKNIHRGHALVKTFSWEKMAKETLNVYESSIGI